MCAGPISLQPSRSAALRLIPSIIRFLGYCPYIPELPLTRWLTLIRQSFGYSQEKMAKSLGIDAGTWRRWEAGRGQPGPKYMGRINAL
jgi:hypothetical protein